MRWKKMRIQVNGETNRSVYYGSMDEDAFVEVLECGGGNSESISNQYIMHWAVGFCHREKTGNYAVDKLNMFEPSYKQKVQIISELGNWNQIALEVMPPEDEVVDRENVYHLWEFEYPYSFMCDITPIYSEPKEFEGTYEGIDYHIDIKEDTTYLYFKPHNSDMIGWRKKQNLKNFLISPYATAVEIIHEQMLDKEYSCMIVLPFDQVLDFSLK